jgi:hypothetical protein
VFAQRVPNFEVLETSDQLLRLLVQLAQFGMTHFVDAFHLPDHEFGIANHLERLDLIFGGVAESGEESLILGVVVGVVSKVFTKLGNRVAGGVVDGNTVSGGTGIAAGSAIDVGGVRGRRGFRRGEKIAGIGRTRRHRASLQRRRGSSEDHRYLMDEDGSKVRENILLPVVGFSGTWMAHLAYSSV